MRTRVRTPGGWLDFQEYFVLRRHTDTVLELDFAGATAAAPAPGVIDAIARADVVVIAPSNPPLSIWPILEVAGIRRAIAAHPRVVAVSPLIGGAAVKGPAADVMSALGLSAGNRGVAEAYEGLIDRLVIDTEDRGDADELSRLVDDVTVTDTLIGSASAGARLATDLLSP